MQWQKIPTSDKLAGRYLHLRLPSDLYLCDMAQVSFKTCIHRERQTDRERERDRIIERMYRMYLLVAC